MGVLNASSGVRMNASFSPLMPPSGRVSLLSQSGALGIAIIELAIARQVGLSTFVSVGNKADVSGNDLLRTGSATRTPASACSTSSRSATLAVSRGSRVALRAASRSWR